MRGSLVLAIAGAALYWSGAALAGYAIQPATGSTTGNQPSFLVYLDSQDSLATVYVAASPDMTSYGSPTQELGRCTPATPYSEANKYTCQPSYYSPSYTSSLAPGTYYWWLTFYRIEPGNLFSTMHVSGPLTFTVAAPTPPADTYLVSPGDGAAVSPTPRLSINAPPSATLNFYVSSTSTRANDGSPVSGAAASCSGSTSNAGQYYCDVPSGSLTNGLAYYWWVIVRVNGSAWVYGPRTFTPSDPASGAGGSGGGGGGGSGGGGGQAQPHDLNSAQRLPSSAHFGGTSVKHTRLSRAAYSLSKILGSPKSIAVACWNPTDWANVSGVNPESGYTVLGFFLPAMPHWVHLSPGICNTFETLLYHRPRFANIYTANAVDTLTHEMIHALGFRNEAQTECYAMQLSFVTGISMGLPAIYAENLDRLSLRNYFAHPRAYIDTGRCREGGQWDLTPSRQGLPWHMPAV
jgi:hypothetical protein